MALVRISDVIVPSVYEDYTAVDSPEKVAFWQSGIVQTSPQFDELARGPSNIYNMPFWNDLDQTILPNLSTDNPADVAVPNKIGTGQMLARTSYLNQWWGSADLVKELISDDPMQALKNRTDMYWQRQLERRLIAATKGILAANIANNASDMVFVQIGPWTRTAYVNAQFTMGDAIGTLSTLVAHSQVVKQMTLNDDIDFVRDSDGRILTRSYMGANVIMDDSMPATATTAPNGDVAYITAIFGPAAFGFGVGAPDHPSEIRREPLQGNGAGLEYFGERKTWLLHPAGHSFTSASVVGQSPTNAELATAANWTRQFPRKNLPIAFVQTTLNAAH
jgi:hypothetical protein